MRSINQKKDNKSISSNSISVSIDSKKNPDEDESEVSSHEIT